MINVKMVAETEEGYQGTKLCTSLTAIVRLHSFSFPTYVCTHIVRTLNHDTVRVEIFGNVIFSVNRERRCSVERNFRYRTHCHFEGVANVR